MTDRLGQQLGNYRLIHLLGQGGFADTYLGEQVYLKTFAAIKVLRAQLAQADQEAFYNEARTIARLKHPNIVRVLEFGVESYTNTPYLVMDHAPNGTLRQRHPRGTPLPPAVIIPYVKQVAAALQYAHDQKLVHRDVKPENMLLGANNEVLLSDFGIAIIAQSARPPGPQDVAGTVTYMAPEQIQGKPRPASDQYALAIVVYEWLCGVVPFNGTYIEVAIQQERVAPSPLREHVPAIPPDVEQVVLIALSKDPQWRFGSVMAFANALEQAAKAAPAHLWSAPRLSPDDSQLHKPTEMISREPIPLPPPAEQVFPPQTGYGAQNPYTPPQILAAPQNPYTPQPIPAGVPNPYTPPPPPPGPQAPFIAQRTEPQGLPITPQPRPQTRAGLSLSSPMRVLLVTLAILLIVGGGGLIYYTAIFQPNQLHAQATATVVAKITGTANAIATSTAQALATVAQATAQAKATATALQAIYTQATSGTPTISDPLTGGDNYGWLQATVGSYSCAFTNGAYHSIAPAGALTHCLATQTNFSNFALQVQMTVISGHSGGLSFRFNPQQQTFYAFFISTDGTYTLNRLSLAGNRYNYLTLTSGHSDAINQSTNPSNTLTVVAQGNTFYLYVNGQYVGSGSDNANSSGEIGVYTQGDASSVEAAFSNLKVWKL